MKYNILLILALAAMAFSTTLHAQRAEPDSLMFEGINLYNTCYDEIVATLGEPDEYEHSPTEFGPYERFWYHFPGPDPLLGEGVLHLVTLNGFVTHLLIQGGQYKLFTDIEGGVRPGDPINWFAQNNFTLGPPEQTVYPGVYQRELLFTPKVDSIFFIRESDGVVVSMSVLTPEL